ncbi:MAG: helix-turn-helix transcriptional regulator [Oscillospiraceae bacterium]|nr:helix-turn-helix transcriptional regulator [Oscillospiraceae bacterium]
MTFHEKLMQLRREHGWSQEQLAEQLGVTRQTVSKWELGSTTPEMNKLLEMSRIFGISIDELTGNTAFSAKPQETAAVPERKPLLRQLTFEYKSKRMIGRLPLVHIHIGLLPKVAKGVFAIGNVALGGCALGLVSAGVLSLGLLAVGVLVLGALAAGVLSFGGISAGILAVGGVALGVFAVGGVACGVYALGGCAIASQIAFGGYASAPVAIGDAAEGMHTFLVNDAPVTYEAVEAAIEQSCPHTPGFVKRLLEGLV